MRPLIDADQAAAQAGAVRLDVRWTLGGPSREADYAAGHLPGAARLDLDRDVCGPAGPVGGRHPLPEPEALQAVLRAAGIDDDTTVLVYDDGDLMAAARTWWTLRWAGLEDVHVLRGGLKAWTDAGLPLETQAPQPREGAVTVRPGSLPVLDAEDAAAWADERELVDVRAPERYRGEFEPMDPVAGHVPGAVNLFLGEDDFADVVRLRERYAPHADAAFYCGSGVGAARTALAVTAAGLPTPPVYIGSWSDWVSQGREVARGEER
ncbi:sulfurtransferase [Glycomyces harbinensis]|uniref:Thiosulfate/3-mercaptopyruvate sulfurtransferase n=1 Tax=Glycomyces harbinensis TaxID=58114 RepID=A0A1G6U0S5_9ACTN|nr:sulfurtransferase [Glycomyces harbinensis]SDD34921.1 thiosulfate/3-mercaptopyruvate sulfurtransferase [Glycomyces harbinensis]